MLLACTWLLLGLLVPWHVQAQPTQVPVDAHAVNPADGVIRPMRDYAVDIWTTREGLPHNSLRKIVQTPDGLIWLATWEGLVRYNGQEFTTFDRGSNPGLLDNAVGSLHVDHQGSLWISDSRGNLSRYDTQGHWQHFVRELPAPGVLIQAMASDAQGRLWLQHEGKGLGHLDVNGRFNYTPPPDDLSVLLTYPGLVVDNVGQVWMGSMEGILLRDSQGVLQRAPASYGLARVPSWPYMAPDGVLWLVVGNKLYRMRDGKPVLHYSVDEQTFLTSMLIDRKGLIWLGTESDGLMRLGPGGLERMPEGKKLPGGRILSLFEDNEGSIWAGANGGLFRLRETLFTSYRASDGLSGDYVRSVLEDRQQRVWVGSAQGLDRMDVDGSIHNIRLARQHDHVVSVLSLAESADGAIWVGTFSDGVIRVGNDGRLTYFDQVQQLSSGNVRALVVDAQDRIWVGTQGGLLRIVDGRVERPEIHGLPKQELVTALGMHEGELWVGSTEGVRIVRPDQVQRLDLNQLGGARTVLGLQSIGKAMWISTDRGLYRYLDDKLGHVGLEQGLPVDAVFQIVPDRLGNVWLSSNRGILRTDMVSLNEVADGRRDRLESVERYAEIDGMSNSQANGSSGPGSMLDRKGRYWVVTAGGLSRVDPQQLRQLRERPSPRPMLENVRVNGQLQDWRNRPLEVPGGARISISYVGLSYLISDRIRYRTRLVGLDEEWIDRGRQRHVEYIGLPPGRYTLQVSSMHPGGRWSMQVAELHFTVTPLWWQNPWVWLAAGLLLLLLLAGLYRYGVYRYKLRSQQLARLVDQRTYDLQLQAESLLAANQEKSRLLDQLREQSEAFQRQARQDALTGLPNRRVFDEALAREFSRHQRSGHPLCLVVLDIDHFKTVNDRFSHSVGDVVLSEVGELLQRACRDGDLPARLGGEEFALLLDDTTSAEAEQLCSRLQALFHARQDWGGIQGLSVTFSAGLVQAQADDKLATDLYRRADHALYRAKSSGRDVTCVE